MMETPQIIDVRFIGRAETHDHWFDESLRTLSYTFDYEMGFAIVDATLLPSKE